ncbi:uncharacterized protein LOC119767846 [Culex quinquefasciatus]|uniref:uncharacterized protein LOC119767846 n=1 Tax=Culex quinquefasciatus TaxID=7176 RepID=UPI0018E31FCD|nr:uncharacterized protein LOC119767846 [Culex quinquefasciatus]
MLVVSFSIEAIWLLSVANKSDTSSNQHTPPGWEEVSSQTSYLRRNGLQMAKPTLTGNWGCSSPCTEPCPAMTQPSNRKNIVTPRSISIRFGLWKSGSASWVPMGIGHSVMSTGEDGTVPVTFGTTKHCAFAVKLLTRD